jgi:hypothetical protein
MHHLFVLALVLFLFGGGIASGLSITYRDQLHFWWAVFHRQLREELNKLGHPRLPIIRRPLEHGDNVAFPAGLVAGLAPTSPAPAPASVPDVQHGAEYFAAELDADPEKFREDTEEIAKEIWRRHHERQLAETNALFDALTASMEGWEHPVTAADYHAAGARRPVSTLPGIQSPTMRALATFSPDTLIQVITEENQRPTVFSWSTGEYAMQSAPGGEVQVAEVEVMTEGWGRGLLASTKILVREKKLPPVTPRIDGRGVVRHRRRGKYR